MNDKDKQALINGSATIPTKIEILNDNLFNIESVPFLIENNAIYNINNTKLEVYTAESIQNSVLVYKIGNTKDYLGKTIYVTANWENGNTNKGYIGLCTGNANGTIRTELVHLQDSTKTQNTTLPTTITTNNSTLFLTVYATTGEDNNVENDPIKYFNIRVCVDSLSTVITEEDYVKNWDMEDFRIVPKQGFVGQFVEKILTLNFKNITKDFVVENKEIVLWYGVKTDSGINWYSLGNYLVSAPKEQNVKDTTNVTAKDYTYKFNKDYVDRIPYPTTARILMQDVCNQAGVELAEESFYREDFVIPNNQFIEGSKLREVAKNIGKLAYSWVRVGTDNKAHLDFEQSNTVDKNDVVTNDNYYQDLVIQKEEYGVVNRIVLGSSNVEGGESVVEQLEDKIDVDLFGKSVQNGTPSQDNPIEIFSVNGINIFNKEDVDVGYRLDSSGNLYHENGYNTSKFIKVQPNTNYYRNVNIIQMEPVCTYDKNKTFIRRIQAGNTFATSESEAFIKTTASDDHLDNMQIEKGTIPHDYVPYNNIQFNDVGENLYNYTKTTNVSTGCTSDENGWITITCDNTTNNTSAYKNYYTYDLPLKNNTPYNVIVEIDEKTGDFANFNVVSTVSNDTQFTENFVLYNAITSGNVYQKLVNTGNDMSSTNGKLGLRTYIAFSPNQAGTVKFRISVLEDTTITTNDFVYKPYEEKIVNVDLQGNELCSMQNDTIKDKLILENGRATIVKNIRHLSLNVSDMNNANDYPGWKNQTQLKNDYPNLNGGMYILGISYMTNIGIQETSGNYFVAINTMVDGAVWLSRSGFGEEYTQDYWKENYPNLTFELYYALKTPEIIDLGEYAVETVEGANTVSLIYSLESDQTFTKYYLQEQTTYQTNPSTISIKKGYPLCELRIDDNPILYTQALRDSALSTKLLGLRYFPLTVTTTGYPWWVGKERVKVIDMDNVPRETYPFNRTISYMGHIKTKVEVTALTKTASKNLFRNDTKSINRRLEIIVDNNTKQLTLLNEQTTDLSSQLSQTTINLTSITNTVKDTQKTIDSVSQDIKVLSNTVQTNQTSTNLQISTIQSTIENGIENVKNTTVDINSAGATFGVDGSPFNLNINYQNLNIHQGTEEIGFFGYDPNLNKTVARIPNLETEKLSAGVHRQEKITVDGEERTGFFYIG